MVDIALDTDRKGGVAKGQAANMKSKARLRFGSALSRLVATLQERVGNRLAALDGVSGICQMEADSVEAKVFDEAVNGFERGTLVDR